MIDFNKFILLKEATKKDFFELANLQRDKPEKAMLKACFAMGGGVMNSAIEHVGDLIHRMTEKNTFSSAGYLYVKEKVKRMLHLLTNDYGFGKEFFENIKNNARYWNMTEKELKDRVYKALDNYANEHEKLPTYNKAQQLAKIAAVSLGRLNIQTTVNALMSLDRHLDTKEDWISFAHEGLQEQRITRK